MNRCVIHPSTAHERAPPIAAGGLPILLITHEFYPKRGGIATFAEEIARATADLGYPIEVWAQAASPVAVKPDWPFQIRRMPLRGSHDLICQVRLARELIHHRRLLRGAAVYLPEPGPMLTMMLLQFFAAFRPARLVLTFHGSEILKFSRSPIRRWLAGRLIRRATRVSAVSQYTRELLLRHFPAAADKIFLTPGAVRADFAVVPVRPAPAGNKVIILTVGRLHPRKGQLETLQALQLLPTEVRRGLEYWIVGVDATGGYESRLRAAAARQPDLVVRFFGGLPDSELSDVYERADIFALTSTHVDQSVEGFGLVYLEAAAHGLPVVAHDVGGVAEAMVDGVTGLLVPSGRPAQLAAAFEKLVHDPALRKKLGAAGREWAARHRWQDSAAALFDPGWSAP